MLIKKNDVRLEEKINLRGGQNSMFFYTLVEKPLFKGAGRLFSKTVIPPLSGVGFHVHENDSEAYYILEGSGIYDDNGEKVRVNKGDITFTPDGTGHALYNDTDSTLVVLMCVLFNFEKDKDLSSLRRVTKAADIPKAMHKNMFGGSGEFPGEVLMNGDDFTGAGRLYKIMHLLPGCSLGNHEHNGETEVFFILGGKAVVTDDGEKHEVEAGDVIITGSGHSHAMENPFEETCDYAALIYFDKE